MVEVVVMIMLFGDEFQYLVVVNRTYHVDNNNDVVLSNGNIDNTEESTSMIMIRRKLILMIYWQSYTVSAIVHLIRSASSYQPSAEPSL